MDTPKIEEILNMVRENLADKKRREQEADAISDECKANYKADVLRLALDFVPGFMHPFAQVENLEYGKWRVIFALPECAPFFREIRTVTDDADGNPEKLDMRREYEVARWTVCEDEIVLDWQYIEKFDDLDQALIYALDRGDNRAKCAEQIIQSEQRWQKYQAEVEAHKKLPYCPLKFGNSAFDSDPYCDADKCAWFIANIVTLDSCAMKIMAHAQMAKVVEYSNDSGC